MHSEELAANYFRVTQTEAQIRKDSVNDKHQANQTHFEVGQRIRVTMVNKPENLPIAENIKKLSKSQKNLTTKTDIK